MFICYSIAIITLLNTVYKYNNNLRLNNIGKELLKDQASQQFFEALSKETGYDEPSLYFFGIIQNHIENCKNVLCFCKERIYKKKEITIKKDKNQPELDQKEFVQRQQIAKMYLN